MEGKFVIRTAVFVILANLVFASSNSGVDSIKATYSECYLGCVGPCFTNPINYGCIIGCQRLCAACAPNCKYQRPVSSLTSFCNVGCSLAKCSEIKDLDQWKRCLGDCSEIDCKV
ncbi:hypothetical protein ABFX02_09G099000 [Erythranthe guttata]